MVAARNEWALPGGLTAGGPEGPDTSDFKLEDFFTFRLVALARATGRILWVRALPQWEDEEDREGRIVWTGPMSDLATDAGLQERLMGLSMEAT